MITAIIVLALACITAYGFAKASQHFMRSDCRQVVHQVSVWK